MMEKRQAAKFSLMHELQSLLKDFYKDLNTKQSSRASCAKRYSLDQKCQNMEQYRECHKAVLISKSSKCD